MYVLDSVYGYFIGVTKDTPCDTPICSCSERLLAVFIGEFGMIYQNVLNRSDLSSSLAYWGVQDRRCPVNVSSITLSMPKSANSSETPLSSNQGIYRDNQSLIGKSKSRSEQKTAEKQQDGDNSKIMPDTALAHPILYGVLSYAYLDQYTPPPYEEQDVLLPADYYAKYQDVMPSTQRYHYQTRVPAPKDMPNAPLYTNKSYEIPSSRHFSFLSIPSYNETEGLFNPYRMILIIKSSPMNKELRTSIRRTYGDTTVLESEYGRIKVFFLVGLVPSTILKSRLLYEQEFYNDMLIVNIVESYQNLTLKTLMAEDLIVAMHATTPYILFGDDDTCINIKKVMSRVQEIKQEPFYIGRVIGGGGLEHSLYTMHVTPVDAIPFKVNFPMGFCSVFSRSLIECHVHQLRRIRAFTHIDDLERGYLSSLCNVTATHDRLFFGTKNHLKDLRVSFKSSPYLAYHGMGSKSQYSMFCSNLYL